MHYENAGAQKVTSCSESGQSPGDKQLERRLVYDDSHYRWGETTVGVLRAFSPAQQREQQREQQRQQMFDTLQAQARVVPEVVGQLQATMQAFITQMERQSQAQTDRLLAGQEAFFRRFVQELGHAVLPIPDDKFLEDRTRERGGETIAGC